jgi:hypothetical protein
MSRNYDIFACVELIVSLPYPEQGVFVLLIQRLVRIDACMAEKEMFSPY